MSVWTVILIIAVIAAIILGVLYFVGRKMQAKQEDQRAQLDQMAQTVNMLVIDKIKAVVSGIYITSIKNLRNVAPPEPEKRGLRAKLTKKSAEFMRKN